MKLSTSLYVKKCYSFTNLRRFSLTHRHNVLFGVLIVMLLLFHVAFLGSIPRGLYQDETAIGINALSIATTLHDEHGHVLPLYFESFGDYKAPLYIYAASGITLLFGQSPTALRLTSTVFFLMILLLTYLIAALLYPSRKSISYFAVVTIGVLPWYFTLSRIGFEVLSQVTCIAAFVYAFQKAFFATTQRNITFAGLAGLFLALSLYAYPTGRLLAPAFFFISLIVVRKVYTRRMLCYITVFLVSCVPYALYSVVHSGSMTARFRSITYVFDPSLSYVDRIQLFLSQYISYFSPEFLLLQGDRNLRHATGFGGQIFWIIAFLAVVGFLSHVRQIRKSEWSQFLLLSVLCSPIAAALTSDGTPHSLRSALLGFFLVLLALEGMAVLGSVFFPYIRAFSFFVGVILLLETSLYVHHYFFVYPQVSAAWFDSYGLPEYMRIAEELPAQELLVTEHISYATVQYFQDLTGISLPVVQSELIPRSKSCLLYRDYERDLYSRFEHYPTQKMYSIDGSTFRMQCFL